MKSMKQFVLFVLVLAFVLVAAGCGPSAEETYFNRLNPAMDEFQAAMDELTAQFNGLSTDALNDQAWMDATFAALDRLEAAAQALAATPADQVPEKWMNLNDILVQVSDQTTVFTSAMKDALVTQDHDALMAAADEFMAIGDLMQQALDELNAGQ